MPKPSLVFLMLFTSTGALFSFAQFVAFFGPLIGLVLGFDAINPERTAPTLPKLFYRDSIINGKFLAGLTTVAVMLVNLLALIAGLDLWVLSVVPGAEEAGRLGVYLVVSLCYIGFWLGVAVLASVLFRSTATSALAVLALWILLAFFVPLGAKVTANALAPAPSAVGSAADIDAMLRHEQVKQAV